MWPYQIFLLQNFIYQPFIEWKFVILWGSKCVDSVGALVFGTHGKNSVKAQLSTTPPESFHFYLICIPKQNSI
jgi:hypothetical protein